MCFLVIENNSTSAHENITKSITLHYVKQIYIKLATHLEI